MKYTWQERHGKKNHANRHHRSKDIKQTIWHWDVTDLEKNRGGYQKQQQ